MIHVAIATDASYVPWAGTVICSLLDRHQPDQLTIHVLHDGEMSVPALENLESLAVGRGSTVRSVAVRDDRIDALPPAVGGGRVTWFRVLLPELLNVPRVLVLDADTLVVDSLEPLWGTELGGAPLGAVCNVVEPAMRRHVSALDLDPRRYLNAGVLLMDLDAMRKEEATAAMLRFASAVASRIRWLDQDTLNFIFKDRWLALHPRWNAMNSLWTWNDWAREIFDDDVLREAMAHPAVLHFEGPAFCKPWHYLSSHEWRDIYRQTLERTPWKHTPLEEKNLLTRVIRRLPRRWHADAYWGLKRIHRRLDGMREPQRSGGPSKRAARDVF